MPSSTPWRNRLDDAAYRTTSPIRPSDDYIERLSPAPSFPLDRTTYTTSRQYARDQPLFGLGLSGPANLTGSFPTIQPDHLYIDQDGGAHVGGKARGTTQRSRISEARSKDGRNGESRIHKSGSRQNKSRGHTRSGSTIDDLANIAIATSPTFDHGNPTLPFSGSFSGRDVSRPATSYVDGYYNDDRSSDRPAKRVRSEKLHPMEWSPRDDRPRTSHTLQPQISMEDAELLLGLRNGYSLSTNTSPVFAHASTLMPIDATEMIQVPASENTPPGAPSDQDNTKAILHVEMATDGPEPEDSLEEEAPKHADYTQNGHPPENQSDEQPEQVAGDLLVPNDKVSETENSKIADEVQHETPKASLESMPAAHTKKPRKIKPDIQAEVCAACQKLQRESNGENTTTQWICCDYCAKWFHLACGGFKDKSETRSVDKFVCKDCEPAHGQTTFVRKSTRVRTAIDYAGLNEGLVKSSEESSTHHYIQPIKDATIKYLPDDFARVRPELLTAEFWENMDNMKRPFVVPACWNPRFGKPDNLEAMEQDALGVDPAPQPSFVTYNSQGTVVKMPQVTGSASQNLDPDTDRETVMECDQDYLDMVMPRNLTVRRVAELYGPEQPVPVIDVKSQETKGQWTLSEWADYYEQQGEKPIRNVISLEVSNSPIGKLIRRPRAVRDIDLEDYVWDNETRTTSNKRPVQFYCLMSVADSYTDFHIDFGGSSVYYHILKGIKTFFFIPPEEKYLKEYEKWCNSDTQNDTWLGDLCNGNVTRVDLHEGDTAFIPGGWIHSVWTPEDSLVIGGNFLTRFDYELQLRVANIEKVTKVPQKFRYPFFQKVMWYALLKYLEEDPVPEEVLRDFHSDEEYRFLRANPIWCECGDLAIDAEPGEPGFNARLYSKSELGGLPALRDYLYRTACIHADIPVPDINKKQIDAVKASIPKGHGDPMRLIKTFAVWCAWKIGNELMPRWVHDHGDGLVTEIKEREKAKEEVFRVPPERVSARHASKAKTASPSAEVLVTPAKVGASAEGLEASSSISRSGSRGGSLRVACDACRKRRIKCRHKEGDDTTANSSPPEIRPRTYSNVSVDVPKLASASPVSSAFDQASTINGVTSDFSNTSDLAQAALASLHSQSSDPNQNMSTTPSGGSAKKGRSKACDECRKSKRRCVHDEYGRIDPAKAAEPSKPRGSATSKRQSRTSDEHPAKRHKMEFDNEPNIIDIANNSDIDSMIDPALMNDPFSLNAIHAPTESIIMHNDLDPELMQSSAQPVDPQNQDKPMLSSENPFERSSEQHHENQPDVDECRTQLHRSVGSNTEVGPCVIPTHMRRSPDVDISYSPITVDGTVAESMENVDVKMEDADAVLAGSRHSLRHAKQIERYVPEQHRTPSKGSERERRMSTGSDRTLITSNKSRRSSSNTSGTTHQLAAMPKQRRSRDLSARPVSRGSSAGSDMNADEKFARELQAAENGLRRRASMRA